jgi:hypothetical protein
MSSLALIGLDQFVGALIAGIEAVLFLLIWTANCSHVSKERHQRLEADEKSLKEERSRAAAEYSRKIAEHDAVICRIKDEHSRSLITIETAHAKEKSRLEEEYRSKFIVYSTQLSLYENAWENYHENKHKWEVERNARAQQVDQTRREMDDTLERLRNTVGGYQSKVRGVIENLEPTYQHFQRVCAEEAVDMKVLETKKREAQLRQFLDSKLIDKHEIARIRSVDTRTLMAYGIESALDVTPSMKKVPGIGEVRMRSLLNWRAECESQFRYNPNTPMPQAEVQAVKLKYAQLRQSALFKIRGGASTLLTLETETVRAVNSLESKISQLARSHSQALADHNECS